MKWMRLWLGLAALMICCVACAPRLMAIGDPLVTPREAQGSLVMSDGAHLPLQSWEAATPHAILLGVHGFNDYSNAFAMPGAWFAAQGVTVYAFDQRGFGKAPGHGLWAGPERMAEDLRTVVQLLRARHPGIPFYILGESMGGALVLHTMASANPPQVDGIILSAPAVWGWRSMNDLYSTVLWASAHLLPSMELTGRGLGRQASDNIDMLRGLGRDPLVIKETQIGTIYGLVELMDAGAMGASGVNVRSLLLYGARDEIVPADPVVQAVGALQARGNNTTMCYPNGWHMLLRDLDREIVWRDINAWMNHATPLPSGLSDLLPCRIGPK